MLGLVDGQTHAWCDGGPVVPGSSAAAFLDLTGDQFGRPPVVYAASPPVGYVTDAWPGGDGDAFRRRARSWLARITHDHDHERGHETGL